MEAMRQKRYYDRKANALALEPSDLVLLRVSGYKGKRKVVDQWDSQPWKLVHQLDDGVPAYVVMAPQGETRVLHRNCLFLLETADSAAPLLVVYASVEASQPTDHLDGSFSSEESQEEEEIATSQESIGESKIQGLARKACHEWIWECLQRVLPWVQQAVLD